MLIHDPNKAVRRFLLHLNMAEISRETGIPQSTLNRYRQKPETLTMARGIEIAEAAGVGRTAWGQLIKG